MPILLSANRNKKSKDAETKITPSHKKRSGENGRKKRRKNDTELNKNELNHEIDEKISGYPDTFNSLVRIIITKQEPKTPHREIFHDEMQPSHPVMW